MYVLSRLENVHLNYYMRNTTMNYPILQKELWCTLHGYAEEILYSSSLAHVFPLVLPFHSMEMKQKKVAQWEEYSSAKNYFELS